MIDFDMLELGLVGINVDFDKKGLEVNSSLLGCCRHGKELVENGRDSTRL